MSGALPPIVETVAVVDTFCSGIVACDDIGGGVVRLTFFSLQRCPFTGEAQRAVQARLVLPKGALPDIVAVASSQPVPLVHDERPAVMN
ncbi:hypothetical protein [Aurantimonas sp. 22II-16-19i]|uniref:hypothetical protein n=1 Tax=Aurantimonas sp. 22II-16-19i TaxID=1317114 RepID=UPI0009F7F32C|nr:hypothetical protein [Aurantimonas sp. 22II-16-19i]ORE97472.1 hypothetical protein ATO4_09137 [Aurantimonas sp. 22II-16-19i]